MTAYCVSRPGPCDRLNCCMDGMQPGNIERAALIKDLEEMKPLHTDGALSQMESFVRRDMASALRSGQYEASETSE